jgi:hypothetical protein
MANYKVLTGVSYADKQVPAGTVVSDLPAKSVTWMLDQGLIEPADDPIKTKQREPMSPEEGDK